MATVYEYISVSNPDSAIKVCRKYGMFQINNAAELSNALQGIVAQDGEEGLKEVLNCHPDKDIIIELFEKPEKDCGGGESTKVNVEGTTVAVPAAPAAPSINPNFSTNTYILVGALIVALAVISIKK